MVSSREANHVMVRPHPEHRWRLATTLLLASVFFERLAFYGLMGNIVFYVSNAPYRWNAADATLAMFLFGAIIFMFPLLAGWISDTYIGKFWTAIVGYVFYLSSYIFLPLLYHPKKTNATTPSHLCLKYSEALKNPLKTRHYYQETCNVVLSLVLSSVAIGAACIRGVVPPLSAMQVEAKPRRLKRFFPFFYWVFNAAALASYSAVAYWQQNISIFYSYMALYGSVALSALLFVIGSPFYITDWPDGSPLTEIFGVLWMATKLSCRRSRCCLRAAPPALPDSRIVPAPQSRDSASPNNSLINEDDDDSSLYEARVSNTHRFLDRAQEGLGGSYSLEAVNRTRIFLRTVLLLLLLLVYWIVFMQMHSTFIIQGLHMDLSFELIKMQIPVSWLLLVEVVTVLFVVPISSCLLSRCKSLGRSASPYYRMALGMVFAILAMTAAGVVEYYRVGMFLDGHRIEQNVSNTIFNASAMPVYWQVPQYVLIGCSDAFTSVAAFECAYTLAPRSSQSIISGMLYFSTGVASLIGVVLIDATDGIFFVKNSSGGSINSSGRVFSTYFFALAILQTLGLVVFWIVVQRVFRPSATNVKQVVPSPQARQTGVYDPNSSAPPVIE